MDKYKTAPYLAMGDSYTIGEGVSPAERWPGQLAAAVRASGFPLGDPVYVAQTGWTAADLQAAITDRDLSPPFSLVTLQIGVNDQYQGLSLDEFKRTAQDLLIQAIELAGGRQASVLAVSIPDWSVTPFAKGRPRMRLQQEIAAYNLVYRSQAQELEIGHVDITPLSQEAGQDPALLTEDMLHPSGLMYRKWVKRVLPYALTALAPSG